MAIRTIVLTKIHEGQGHYQKEEYKKVMKELKRGISARKTAKLCDVSISTVQRLKKEFGL